MMEERGRERLYCYLNVSLEKGSGDHIARVQENYIQRISKIYHIFEIMKSQKKSVGVTDLHE